jgi:nucleoid-associated protein YejK
MSQHQSKKKKKEIFEYINTNLNAGTLVPVHALMTARRVTENRPYSQTV